MSSSAQLHGVEVQCRAHPGTSAEASCARCGDFMCRLCGPLSPQPLCARCGARGAVDWEERGDQSWGRALFATFREAVSAPRRLGARLSGVGRVGAALSYVAVSALIGALPLGIAVSSSVLTVLRPLTLGIRSTGVLSLAVTIVLAAVGVATLLPLLLCIWAGCVRGVAGLFGLEPRFDLLVRASAYGLSLLAVPLFGPLLLPGALLWMLVCVHATLAARRGPLPAWAALLVASALALAPFALFWAL